MLHTPPAAHPVHRRMPLETQAISQALHDSGLFTPKLFLGLNPDDFHPH